MYLIYCCFFFAFAGVIVYNWKQLGLSLTTFFLFVSLFKKVCWSYCKATLLVQFFSSSCWNGEQLVCEIWDRIYFPVPKFSVFCIIEGAISLFLHFTSYKQHWVLNLKLLALVYNLFLPECTYCRRNDLGCSLTDGPMAR